MVLESDLPTWELLLCMPGTVLSALNIVSFSILVTIL